MEGRLAELPLFLHLQGGGHLLEAPLPGGATSRKSHFQEVPAFDAVVGYNALIDEADKAAALASLRDLLAPTGVLSLAERVPAATQRIHRLVDAAKLGPDLTARWAAAEEAIYARTDDPLTNWRAPDLLLAAQAAGLEAELQTEDDVTEMQITPALIDRWFTPAAEGKRSYADHLAVQLTQAEIAAIRALCEVQLRGQTAAWSGMTAYLTAQVV
jgi:putative ATPase